MPFILETSLRSILWEKSLFSWLPFWGEGQALERFVRSTFPADIADDIVSLHTLAPDVGRVFSRSKTRLGVLTHLDNNPDEAAELIEQVRTNWDGPLVVGEDMMVIEVGRTVEVIYPEPN